MTTERAYIRTPSLAKAEREYRSVLWLNTAPGRTHDPAALRDATEDVIVARSRALRATRVEPDWPARNAAWFGEDKA